jgi:hypothetical protein
LQSIEKNLPKQVGALRKRLEQADKENEALKKQVLSNQNPCRSIKRPNISIRKAKMVVAELNARELEQREIKK